MGDIGCEMIINIVFILFLPLMFLGIINRVKSVWAGRKGPSLLQPYYDFAKLMRKNEVISSSTSFVFDMAPSISLACILGAAMFVPFGHYRAVISFQGDFILFVYLLAMAKFFSVLGALDTGSSFEGMGASRELSYTSFLEPAFIMVVGSLVYAGGLGSLSQLVSFHSINLTDQWSVIISVLTVLNLFIIMLIEGCRVPFDDPNTHLELTMVHEVMVLDNSGPNLAYTMYGSALKLNIFTSLISYFLIPWARGFWFVTAMYLLIYVILAVAVGLVESLMPRLRMSRNLELALIPLSISLLILCALIVNNYGGMQ
jgi:formate hydrogenlyase subunit 4